MNGQRYLIARFTKDLRRREPKNFGVILWTKHKVASRFLPLEQYAKIGADRDDVENWIDYWEHVCKDGATHLGKQPDVSPSDSKILDVIQGSCTGSFSFVVGGSVAEPIRKRDVNSVINDLYVSLIQMYPNDEAPGGLASNQSELEQPAMSSSCLDARR